MTPIKTDDYNHMLRDIDNVMLGLDKALNTEQREWLLQSAYKLIEAIYKAPARK